MMNIVRETLLLRPVRMLVGKLRFYYFTKVGGKVRTINSDHAIGPTVEHNLKAISKFGFRRMDLLIKPLSVLENVKRDARILVIGPRNEDDILNLIGHGFDSRNITGLDLISYSPFIEIGDMHKMQFADQSFDVVICGWTLSYSSEPGKFATEVMRVIRNNGVIAIGVEYSTLSDADSMKIHGNYHLNTSTFERINSTRQILDLFGGHVKHVFFDHDAPNRISHQETMVDNVSNVVAIFSVRK